MGYPASQPKTRLRTSGLAPLSGATLLLLVTMVLATTPTGVAARALDSAPIPDRWSDSRAGRVDSTDEDATDHQPKAPTRPSQWVRPSQWGGTGVWFTDAPFETISPERARPAPRRGLVRVALLDLPPPTAL